MKLLEIINVDFSLRHFLLPLMRGARERGHEVIGACGDGPLLEPVRAEGFRVEGLPPMRSLSPSEQARAHADRRLSRPRGGANHGRAARRLYVPRISVQPARPLVPPRRLAWHGVG